MTRDRIENALRRVHTDALTNAAIDVYAPSVTYSAGEGYDVSYPADPTQAGIDARADEPQPDADRDSGGTTAAIDRLYRVRDDARDAWTGFGEDGAAAVRIEDTATGETFTVESVVDERNGIVRLECRER